MKFSSNFIKLLFLIRLFHIQLVGSFDPYSSHARIRVEDGNIVFEAPPRKSISFKSNLGSILINGDNLSNVLIRSSSSNVGQSAIDGSSAIDQRINSLKDSVDKLNEYSDALSKTREFFNPGRRQYEPRDFHRALSNLTRLTDEFNRLKQRLEENLCSTNPCRNGGTCLPAFQSYICECREGWDGANCDSDVDECLKFSFTDLGCQNGATCINLPGTYQCNCINGFYGVHCTQRSDDCSSSSNEALCGHGNCLSVGKPVAGKPHYTCLCDQGWTTDGVSPACRVDVDECSSSMPHCSINPPVECINFPGGFTCGPCPVGYKKQGFYCLDVDECQLNNGGCSISPRVECRNVPGSRECGPCPLGFSGDGVTCTFAGICSMRNGDCSPIAQCVEITASAGPGRSCQCPPGYMGNGEGPNGCLASTSITCDQRPCVSGICITVNSNPPSFRCQCQPGFSGSRCEISTLNPCNPNPCLNGGFCLNNPILGGRCRCLPAYTGDRCQDQRLACTGDFDSETGILSYPSNGGKYLPDTTCNWKIRSPIGKVIRLTFTELDLENSFDCHADSILIYDGLTNSAPLIGKYCGDISKIPENHTITTEQPYTLITFTSDPSNEFNGFSLNWTAITPECGGVINETDFGSITSPRYPDPYPPGRDCYWFIRAPLGKRITFHFALLSLEYHATCEFDFLRVYDGISENDPILGNFCNTTNPPPMTTSGPFALIHFHSDNNRQDAGFHITYATIPAIIGCGGLLTNDKGSISSPSFPNRYESNLECDWVIRVKSSDEKIELRFDSFYLEHHPNCFFDYIEVRDGDEPNSPLIGRYCSEVIRPPNPIVSRKNKLFIRFRSDLSLAGTGFLAKYEVLCGGQFTGETGTIKTPNYPYPYPPMKNCTYHIQVPQGKVIQLSFSFFDLEDSPNCYQDYVTISDPGVSSSNQTERFCGSQIPDQITSNLNELIIHFKSDFVLSNLKLGFIANYSTIDASCGGVLREKNGVITSPSHPEEYSHAKECTWILSAPKGYIVQLTFTLFNLEPSRKCNFDYVEIMDKSYNIGRFCGNSIPPVIQSSEEQLILKFKSDTSISFEGFVASYSFIDGSKHCGGTLRAPNGEIVSPNYPRRYPASRRCLWKIIGPENNQIRVQFMQIDLESHDTCVFDYIEIYNGQDTSAPLVGRYCKSKLPSPVVSHSNTMVILFVSDSGVSGPGFRLKYDIAETGCGGVLKSASGLIISPNYPFPYNHNAQCTWIIKTSKGSRLILNIVDLAFESHQICTHDRLDIFDGPDDKSKRLLRACGDQLITEPIRSTSDSVTVKMVTDASVAFRGFKLNYATNCTNTIRGTRGAIETPNYPNLYSGNSNCSWKISVPQGNNISLAFQELKFDSPCSSSYLLITSLNKGNQSKYCDNNSTVGSILIRDHDIRINYVNINSTIPVRFRLEWALDGCGGEFTTNPDGSVTKQFSPNYPNPYPNGLSCQWTIKAKPGNQIVLNVIDYYVEAGQNCQFDSLQVYSGLDTTSPRLMTLCGQSSTTKTVSSNGNYMTIVFSTDSSISGKGFAFEFYSKIGNCGSYQNLEEGTIISPNYPNNYSISDDCLWTISNTDHRIKVTIQDIDIPISVNCSESYLEFNTPNDDSDFTRLCGNQVPTQQIISKTEYLRIRFKADGNKSGKGFKFLYQAICGGIRYAYSYTKTITNPNYPSISIKNPNCDWIIKNNDTGSRILWSFNSISISQPGSLEFREGDSMDSPLIARYTSSIHPPPIITQGNSLFVREEGNVIFSAFYSTDISRCGGNFNSFSGFFTSPGYPSAYPLSTSCIWIIRVAPGNRVTLSFTDFNFESDDFCALDYLEIRETNSFGPLVGRFCGQSIPMINNSTLYSGLWIKFQSDGQGSAPGFQASFETSVNVDLTGSSGVIASPGYPKYYSTDKSQSWTITVEDNLVVSFKFTYISIAKPYIDCLNWYVAIYDGTDSTYPLLGKFCGYQVKQIITTSSNVAHVIFKPNFLSSQFNLRWKAEPKNISSVFIGDIFLPPSSSIPCTYINDTQLGQNMSITSPGYPQGYIANLNCSWTISSPMGTHLEVKIVDLYLETAGSIDNDCNYDKVSFYDYNFEENVWQINRTLCGKTKINFNLTSDLSKIIFSTDSHVNRVGFNLTVAPICGGLFHNTHGFINSSLLQSYGSCSWRIIVREGRTISLKFNSFSLGPNQNPCTKGYLDVRDGPFSNSPLLGHFCGTNLPSEIESSSNHLNIFVNAPQSTSTDFSIEYREVSSACGGIIELDEVNNPSVMIESPGYPLPPAHALECDWLIKGPDHRVLRLDFMMTASSVHDYSSCNTNLTSIDVHDGGTELSPRLGRYCPRPRASALLTTENLMFIRFKGSGDLIFASFQATVSIHICGGSYFLSSSGAVIQSPNYPLSYENNMMCVYHFHASRLTSSIYATITSLDLPSEVSDDCTTGDYLEFRESDSTGDFIGRVCGTRNSSVTVKSKTNVMYLLFRSNLENTGQGFKISLKEMINYDNSDCYANSLNASQPGTIRSPQFPAAHPAPRVCSWTIIAPFTNRITLIFTNYNLKADTRMNSSCLDSLELSFDPQQTYLENYVEYTPNKLSLPCGFRSQFTVKSTNNIATLTFKTNGLNQGEGFAVNYFASEPTECGGIVTKDSPAIVSTNFSNPIDDTLINCIWKVDDPFEQGLGKTRWIEYEKIEILGSDTNDEYCSNARITQGSIRDKRNTITDIICGNKTNHVSIISQSVSPLGLTARINRTRGYRGLKATYRSSDCGGLMYYINGNFSSPGWPANYPVNTTCLWEFFSIWGQSIQVNFTSFELESDCSKDYLEIREGPFYDSALVGRYCANNMPPPYTSSGSRIVILFKSDGIGNGKGFNFQLSNYRRVCGGAVKGGPIYSKRYPDVYPNNIECIWNIELNEDYRVNLTFINRFDIEQSVNCTKDFVEIKEWSDNDWRSKGKYCGLTAPKSIILSGNKGQVIFHSDDDDRRGDGFYLIVTKQCGYTIDKLGSGIIRTPGFPTYHDNTHCEWTLKGQRPTDIITLTFDEFDLEPNPACVFDYVMIIKGNLTTRSDVIGRFCGKDKPDKITVRGNSLIIFNSDGIHSLKGFTLSYQIIPCGGEFNSSIGEISSPNIDGNYAPGVDCSYLIRGPENYSISLELNSFSLYNSELCYPSYQVFESNELDYLEIRDGPNRTDHLVLRICGTHGPMKIRSTNNEMLVVFHSDEYLSSTGFTASWDITPGLPMGCGGLLNSTTGTIQSPDIDQDGRYENNLDCNWMIISDGENDVIEITFSLMDIEASSLSPRIVCSNDYLEIRDGLSYSSPLIDHFCSSELPSKIITTSSKVYLYFHTNSDINGAGFKLSYRTVNNTCGGQIDYQNDVIISSPNYPNAYPPTIRCRWVFPNRFEGSVTRIDFVDVDLDCNSKDLLEITGNSLYREPVRICGSVTPPPIHFGFEDIVIIFNSRSPNKTKHRGFSLNYRQSGCDGVYTEESGLITNVRYPYVTQLNVTCNFTIRAQPGYTISIYFHDASFLSNYLNMGNCGNSTKLMVKDGDSAYKSLPICTKIIPEPIFSLTSNLSVVLSTERYRYVMIYTTTNAGPGCGGNIRAFNGTFTSPLYPKSFSNATECTWNIFNYGIHSITFRFVTFDFTSLPGCTSNFVEIYDNSLVGRYCGSEIPATYISRGSSLRIKMVTSSDNRGNGFLAEFGINNYGLPNSPKIISKPLYDPIRNDFGFNEF